MCKANQCVVCGTETPEGDHLCGICKKTVETKVTTNTEADIRKAAAKIKDFAYQEFINTRTLAALAR